MLEGSILDGRYQILQLLAEGGMGAVYRARRLLLGDEVAVKVVRPDAGDPVTQRERFLRESRACALLRHPHIVAVLDYSADKDGSPYLVMELLNGPSVAKELATTGPFDLSRVARIISPICAALQVAHERRILHRDLKPANIVSHRYDSGEIIYKLVDFGLANLRQVADETRLTAAHQFLGTVGYASPEQIRGETLDGRSDVYSLGVVVFEMLTGRPPFQSDSAFTVVTQHLSDEPPPPSRFKPGLPDWIGQAVVRALAKNPADRWPTILEFGRALSGPADTMAAIAPGAPSGLLARYDLGARIGQGRMGSEVYSGVHRALQHPVAIRTLRRTDPARWDAIRTRFIKEARTLQATHPSIIAVRDFGEENDVVYVVTDLFQGSSLRELLNHEAPLSWPRVERFVAQLADAAEALHQRDGLLCGSSPEILRVTRDRDGERLMISSGGIYQVQDLLATASDQTLRGAEMADPELRYMAPEVLMGKTPTKRSDLYTIGVLAFEMATGTVPFDAHTLPELLGATLDGRPANPAELNPAVPAAAGAAILTCLQRRPSDRFASAAAFLAEWTSAAKTSGAGGPGPHE